MKETKKILKDCNVNCNLVLNEMSNLLLEYSSQQSSLDGRLVSVPICFNLYRIYGIDIMEL